MLTTSSPVQELYDRGAYLDAWREATRIAPVSAWGQRADRILLARLMSVLGGDRLGDAVFVRAFREGNREPEILYYYGRYLEHRKGPWEALRFLGPQVAALVGPGALLKSFYAVTLGRFRDFERAEEWMNRALADSDEPWTRLERARLLELMDRYEEALQEVEAALALRPLYHPAVMMKAHCLDLLERRSERLALLEEAARQFQSPYPWISLAFSHEQGGDEESAHTAWQEVRRHAPLADKAFSEWLEARLADSAYRSGRREEALAAARKVKGSFYVRFAERLAAGPDPSAGRRLLHVPFVRQHHMTCAPATLAAIGRFWDLEVDHLEVAERICYDGTSALNQRIWGEGAGLWVREFTVTWEGARRLIDAGVPFTVSTLEANNAHLQAVIGYDTCRETLLIRDPFNPGLMEFEQGPFFERYRATGPRGMVLLPQAEAGRLEGEPLDDSGLYDLSFQFQEALERHDREEAVRRLEGMREVDPDHYLVLQTERALAHYDGDTPLLGRILERLLEKYPENQNLLLARLYSLRDLGTRAERLDLLARVCKPGADAVFWTEYAVELAPDPSRRPEADAMLEKALKGNPFDPGLHQNLGDRRWEHRDFEGAYEAYRLAACLGDKTEAFWNAFFQASRFLRKQEEALAVIRDRVAKLGAKSPWPWTTCFRALTSLDRIEEGFQLLDRALAARPEDGELLRFAAVEHGASGRFEKAQSLLQAARGRLRAADLLRAEAQLLEFQGHHRKAAEKWAELVEREPLAIPARRSLCAMMDKTAGREAVLEHLRAALERFPHHAELRQLWVDWLYDEPVEVRKEAVLFLLEHDPNDAWAWRELGVLHSQLGEAEESARALNRAAEVDPENIGLLTCRGSAQGRLGEREQARAFYLQAVRRAVDFQPAVHGLWTWSHTVSEQIETLNILQEEIERQPLVGNTLLYYRDFAAEIFPQAEVLKRVEAILASRRDVWYAWSACIQQLIDMDRGREAIERATEAVDRFNLLPGAWTDLARSHRACDELDLEEKALQRAVELSPTWPFALRELAGCQERQGRYLPALGLLERAVAAGPCEHLNLGCLADLQWKTGNPEKALATVARALRFDPEYLWAWEVLVMWSDELGRKEYPLTVARELAASRPRDPRCWILLAQALREPEELEEQLDAFRRAIACDPARVESHQRLAEALMEAGRMEEAREACRPSSWPGELPPALRLSALRIDFVSGRSHEAVAELKDLLTSHPQFVNGWLQLAYWLDETADDRNFRETCDRLVELAPQMPTGHYLRARALLRTDERAEAREELGRALRLLPDYRAAGFQLLDLLLEDDQLSEAAQVLGDLKRHAPGHATQTREVDLLARRGLFAEAEKLFRNLGRDADFPPGWLASLFWLLREKLPKPAFAAVREDLLQDRAFQPEVAFLVVVSLIRDGREAEAAAAVAGFADSPAHWHRAAGAWVEEMAERGAHRKKVLRFVRRNGPRLKEETATWGAVGYALARLGAFRELVRWKSDWTNRADVAPWMLQNFSYALLQLGKVEKAFAIFNAALQLRPDHTYKILFLGAVLGRVYEGRCEEAGAMVRGVAIADQDTATSRFSYWLARACDSLAVADGTASPRAEIKAALAEARQACPNFANDRVFRRIYRRGIWGLAKRMGAARGPFWYAAHRLRHLV